jgi:hypothetical protein
VRPCWVLLQLDAWLAKGGNVLRNGSSSTPSVCLPQQLTTQAPSHKRMASSAHDLADI